MIVNHVFTGVINAVSRFLSMVDCLQQANRFCSDHPAGCLIELKVMARLFMRLKSRRVIIKLVKENLCQILWVLRDVELMATSLIRQRPYLDLAYQTSPEK